MRISKQRTILYLVTVMLLSSCGGSDERSTDDFPPSTPVPQPPPNTAPVVDAGQDLEVDENTDVTLLATASDDGTTLTHSWVQISGPSVTLQNASSPSADFRAPEVAQNTQMTFEYTATDEDGLSSSDRVNITVLNTQANTPPSVNAGDDLNVLENSNVTLNAIVEDQESTFTFSWSQLSGPHVDIQDDDTLTPSFTAPSLDTGFAIIELELVAVDEGGLLNSDTITITVNNEDFPSTINGNWRIKTQRRDHDGNAIFEEVTENTYDASGALFESITLYTDDGITDSPDAVYSQGARYDTSRRLFLYDSENRIASLQSFANGERFVEFTYSFDINFNIMTHTQRVDNFIGTPNGFAFWEANFTYDGERLKSFKTNTQPDAPTLIEAVIEYNDNSLVKRYTLTTDGSDVVYEIKRGADNRIEGFSSTNSDGNTLRNNTLTYDGIRLTSSKTEGIVNTTSTYEYNDFGLLSRQNIDNNNDGSIDTIIEYEWEQVMCADTAIWFMDPSINAQFQRDIPLATQVGTGWGWLATCLNVQ